ncbi:MAG: recombinase family protein [Desulfovibrio sp.]|nr:recombinase family protein [Desulfovibrio sp.]
MKWGYVRVSTKGQHLRRQLDAMYEEGIDDAHVIIDKASGKNFDRAGYRRLLRLLKPKDILCIQSLDRLGRSYEEVPVEWNRLVREKKVFIRILDMNLLNSREGMTKEEFFMANMMLMFTSFSADQEREKIHERQKQGIAAAKKRGVKFGRQPLSEPENFEEAVALYKSGELTGVEAAKQCGMNVNTFYKKARKRK